MHSLTDLKGPWSTRLNELGLCARVMDPLADKPRSLARIQAFAWDSIAPRMILPNHVDQ